MSPDLMKALAGDPEIIRMLRDPKMQDIMSAVMTGGPTAMKKVQCVRVTVRVYLTTATRSLLYSLPN